MGKPTLEAQIEACDYEVTRMSDIVTSSGHGPAIKHRDALRAAAATLRELQKIAKWPTGDRGENSDFIYEIRKLANG